MYKPELPNQYKGNQAIISSGRILFNAKEDAVMFFAKKSIILSSAGTLNLDSDDYAIIGSPKIYLGLGAHSEKEPLLLGTQTNELLKTLVKALTDYSDLIRTGGGSEHALMAGAGLLEGKLKSLSQVLKNKELLSKKNFTD